jgi:methyl halide transferase
MDDRLDVNLPDYWNARYHLSDDGWDMGSPTPAFVDLLESKRFDPGDALVIGCGKGYDAVLFAKHGFNVTAIDFAEEAIKHTRALAEREGVDIQLVHEDLFDYSLGLSEEFDYIIEYVTFCAIHPSRRAEFAATIPSLMRNHGRFIALFFPLDDRQGGPPFSVSMDEVHRLFGKKLELISLDPPERSVTPRKGKEMLTVWRKL